ncbi:anthranilate synthase family protein [Nocardiopsis sp. N85]|uniref:anthranilate synthase family protein n=1 Tax=Nocardiopsis sp. N85 TaxID=3029400 RepID=UPI00237EEC04|nr:anthranilate synthase family protein [Nocardiopsis sp. N85]MDE3723787.1 anthranilate synthase family protein [Nocardiopsis sp. N85]
MTAHPHDTDSGNLLDRIVTGAVPAFALVHRPESGPGAIEVLTGTVSLHDSLADIPLEEGGDAPGPPGWDVLVAVPYRQISERGFASVDDGAPIISLKVSECREETVERVLERVPDTGLTVNGGDFDIDDDTYSDTVRRVITEEIGRGEGSNFVLRRSFTARIEGFGHGSALSLFRRLLEQESGTYWTFVLFTPEYTLVGATPERHVSLEGGTAVMNPISGTYRYPAGGPTLNGMVDFLADRKEADELYMVVDEELKMMARICDSGLRVVGPRLKEMARLAHTEYLIQGECDRDPREILRETMFAPTVTGSPLENACRVIARYETLGRGHYSGALALIGRDARGAAALDSAILIRTAEIDRGGHLRLSVGATLVRHSVPESEVVETRAKAAGLLSALNADRSKALAGDPTVLDALAARNARLSGFWLGRPCPTPQVTLDGMDILVVDAEDTFTAMLAHQLRSCGASVRVRGFAEEFAPDGYDLVIMGPGPGDPRDLDHPKIARVRAGVRTLLARRSPFLAVCLSHQALSLELGLPVLRREHPNQGAQHLIDLFGHQELVGFYNTFSTHCEEDKIHCEGLGAVEVSRDPGTGEVHALRGPWFASVQFHTESVLTRDGVGVITRLITEVAGR